MLKLHDYVLSADCYTVRLMLGLVGASYEAVAVEYYPRREHEEALGGALPVLEDGDLRFTDVAEMLTHIAVRYDPARTYFPVAGSGLIAAWVGFARTDLHAVEEARLLSLTGGSGDLEGLRLKARRALRILEDRVTDRTIDGSDWVVRSTPSLAEIACFPLVALSHDAGIGLEDFPALNLWQRRVRRLPGFVAMPGIPDYF